MSVYSDLIESAGVVRGLLVVLQHSGALRVARHVTGGAAHELLLTIGTASDARAAEAILDEEHALIGLGLDTTVLLLEGVEGAHAVADRADDGNEPADARAPVATGASSVLTVLAENEATTARGDEAETAATGFGAAITKSGGPVGSGGDGGLGGHVGNLRS